MEKLKGHVSPQTAYVVDDYPYGFRLRCKMRYWLEWKPGFGFRLMTQSSNPKRGGKWNNPKAATYAKFGAAMYLNDEGHVRVSVLTEYCNGAEAKAWSDAWRDTIPEGAPLETLDRWVAGKVAYDANRKPGDPLHVGLPEARAAMVAAKLNPAPEEMARRRELVEGAKAHLSDVAKLAYTPAEAVYCEARENGATAAEAIARANAVKAKKERDRS